MQAAVQIDAPQAGHVTQPETLRLISPRFDVSQKPVWDLVDLSLMIGLPFSTLLKVLDEHPAPLFLLGRKKYIDRQDALDWLKSVAAANPFVKRKNNTQK